VLLVYTVAACVLDVSPLNTFVYRNDLYWHHFRYNDWRSKLVFCYVMLEYAANQSL